MLFAGIMGAMFGITLLYVSITGKHWQQPWMQLVDWANVGNKKAKG